MERTIWKFNFDVTDHFTISMPKLSKILSVQVQYNNPTIWVLCNPSADCEDRNFRLIGTGHPIKSSIDNSTFIGTFQLMDGRIAHHLFEE